MALEAVRRRSELSAHQRISDIDYPAQPTDQSATVVRIRTLNFNGEVGQHCQLVIPVGYLSVMEHAKERRHLCSTTLLECVVLQLEYTTVYTTTI